MSTSKHHHLSRTIFFILTLAIIALFFQSCTKKLTFAISSVVPSAEGTVKIKQDRNHNYKIDLNVIRLSEPERLTPPKDVYIVWMDSDDNGITNIGQLKTSKSLKSSLNTVTSFKPKSFFITAEDHGNIQYSGDEVVLRTGTYWSSILASAAVPNEY